MLVHPRNPAVADFDGPAGWVVVSYRGSHFPECESSTLARRCLTALTACVAIGLALADSDSQEVRTRLDRVMKGWTEGVFDPEVWRRKRAVVAMELAGTEEARKLLARWAADAPGTTLSDDAARALKRVEGMGK